MSLLETPLTRNQEILGWYYDVIARDDELLDNESFSDFRPISTSPRPLTAFAIEVFYRHQQRGPRPVLLNTLFGHLATHYDPHAAIEGFTPKKADIDSFPYESCPDAEPNFDNSIRQIEKAINPTEKQLRYHTKLSVYHDDDNTPLFLRKKSFAATALALTSFRLGDLPVPAGTIVGLGHPAHNTVTGQKQDHDIMYSSFHFDAQKHPIRPLRLSPWAFVDPRDSELFAIDSGEILETPTERTPQQRPITIDGMRRKIVARRALSDFQTAATDLLSYCQS